MIAIAFADCRGWLTLPEAAQPTRAGIVLFGAQGVEDLSTRHSLAQLAARLAAAGHPVLRFDLPHTGDSLDDWDACGQLGQWVTAGTSAVAALQQHSGVQPVCLLGLRLGSMVAALVAQALQQAGAPAQGLALLAPVVQGRQYVRELRALSHGTTPLTVAGFAWHTDTLEALGAVDLSHMELAPAAHVFLGVPATTKALDTLQSNWGRNAQLRSVPYPDLAQHIGNPTLSQPPVALFDALVQWFAQGPFVAQSTAPTSAPTTRLQDAQFVEEGAILSAEVGLAAVWCWPTQAAAGKPVVVFCNAGRNPHMGWARSSVTMARQLAALGIASLRFDLAGLGDSPDLPEPPPEVLYHRCGVPQLRAALDAVQARMGPSTGLHARMCVLGSCSGGYLAFHEALDDVRVSHLVLVNVQRLVWREGISLQAAMRTSGKSTKAYGQRVLQLDTWLRLLRGQVDLRAVGHTLLGRARRALASHAPGAGKEDRAIVQGFAALAQRGTQVAVVYSEEDGGRDEFARYFGPDAQAFTTLPHTQLHLIPNADHDLSSPEARAALFEVLCEQLALGPGQITKN